MIIQIDVPDGSPELEELQHVVAEINAINKRDAESAGREVPAEMTVQEYVVPIVLGHFRKRVQNIYLQHAKTKTTAELKGAFGTLSNVRGKKNGK